MTETIRFRNSANLDRMTSQPRLSTFLQRSVQDRSGGFYSPAQRSNMGEILCWPSLIGSENSCTLAIMLKIPICTVARNI